MPLCGGGRLCRIGSCPAPFLPLPVVAVCCVAGGGACPTATDLPAGLPSAFFSNMPSWAGGIAFFTCLCHIAAQASCQHYFCCVSPVQLLCVLLTLIHCLYFYTIYIVCSPAFCRFLTLYLWILMCRCPILCVLYFLCCDHSFIVCVWSILSPVLHLCLVRVWPMTFSSYLTSCSSCLSYMNVPLFAGGMPGVTISLHDRTGFGFGSHLFFITLTVALLAALWLTVQHLFLPLNLPFSLCLAVLLWHCDVTLFLICCVISFSLDCVVLVQRSPAFLPPSLPFLPPGGLCVFGRHVYKPLDATPVLVSVGRRLPYVPSPYSALSLPVTTCQALLPIVGLCILYHRCQPSPFLLLCCVLCV